MAVKHSFTSAKSDGADTTLVRPSDWNANHTIDNSTITEAMLSIADNTTGNVSTSAHGFAPKAPNDGTKFLDGTGAYSTPAGGGYPLDSYALDGTLGEHFTGASLDPKWTRRNFTSGAESYQIGKNQTFLRISQASRSAGDGYFQSASADGTYGAKFIPRYMGSNTSLAWNVALLDTNGTGVGLVFYNNPVGFLLTPVTTYSTYGGSFEGVGGNTNPITEAATILESRPVWVYIRKSGTSCFGAYSLDGETWSTQSGAVTWSGTLAKAGFLLHPLGAVNGGSTTVIDVDWFNKFTP